MQALPRGNGRLGAMVYGAPTEARFDLNLQMNYWPADVGNLSETMDPLVAWLTNLSKHGEMTARTLYHAPGWLSYHATNPFGSVSPSGSNQRSQFINGLLDPLAGAWMALTPWRHYQFRPNHAFLEQKAYPLLKGSARFILHQLMEGPEDLLIIVPSGSPENNYIHPEAGSVRLTYGSTYHTSLAKLVLRATHQAATILDTDAPLRNQIEKTLDRLPPFKIGRDGTIQEWIKDYQEAQPGHRHMSHLIGAHPFDLITPADEKLFDAAKKTIARRIQHGGGRVGWSRAWLISFYARFHNGEEAHRHTLELVRGSLSENLFDKYGRIFQIDGNFGAAAGIAEMLVQSHLGNPIDGYTIHLLPALPPAWSEGSVQGLRGRGNVSVEMTWSGGKLVHAVIHAAAPVTTSVRYGDHQIPLTLDAGQSITLDGRL